MAPTAKTIGTFAITKTFSARPHKIGAVAELMRRAEAAALGYILEATGCLPHSASAVLNGFRKKNHYPGTAMSRDDTCYRIDGPAR